MNDNQQVFDEFMIEFKKLDTTLKQDELVEKLKSILAYLTMYAVNKGIEYIPIKSNEINDLNDEPTTDDYIEAMMVYTQNIEELMGMILQVINMQ